MEYTLDENQLGITDFKDKVNVRENLKSKNFSTLGSQ